MKHGRLDHFSLQRMTVPGTTKAMVLEAARDGRDEVGNMISHQVGSSGVTAYTYDINRQVFIDYPGSAPEVSKTYDADGHLTKLTNSQAERAYGRIRTLPASNQAHLFSSPG